MMLVGWVGLEPACLRCFCDEGVVAADSHSDSHSHAHSATRSRMPHGGIIGRLAMAARGQLLLLLQRCILGPELGGLQLRVAVMLWMWHIIIVVVAVQRLGHLLRSRDVRTGSSPRVPATLAGMPVVG